MCIDPALRRLESTVKRSSPMAITVCSQSGKYCWSSLETMLLMIAFSQLGSPGMVSLPLMA